MIEIKDNGAVVDQKTGQIIGEVDENDRRIVLNLAWMRLADVRLTVEGDPKTDKRRIVLARPQDPRRLAGGDQEPLPMDESSTEPGGSKDQT